MYKKNKSISIFESRSNLIEFLLEEKEFKIQIFSLEAIEIFEAFLKFNNILYDKNFSSSFVSKNKIILLFDDGPITLPIENLRIILFSNKRNYSFIPYKFKLEVEEKKRILVYLKQSCSKSAEFGDINVKKGINENIIDLYPKSTLTSLIINRLDVFSLTSKTSSYIQSVIIMCMIKESKFAKIFREVVNVDSNLKNKFVIKCELNSLLQKKICSKVGDSYKLVISKLSIQKICESIGFKDIFINQ